MLRRRASSEAPPRGSRTRTHKSRQSDTRLFTRTPRADKRSSQPPPLRPLFLVTKHFKEEGEERDGEGDGPEDEADAPSVSRSTPTTRSAPGSARATRSTGTRASRSTIPRISRAPGAALPAPSAKSRSVSASASAVRSPPTSAHAARSASTSAHAARSASASAPATRSISGAEPAVPVDAFDEWTGAPCCTYFPLPWARADAVEAARTAGCRDRVGVCDARADSIPCTDACNAVQNPDTGKAARNALEAVRTRDRCFTPFVCCDGLPSSASRDRLPSPAYDALQARHNTNYATESQPCTETRSAGDARQLTDTESACDATHPANN
ncbi:hypothetical protein HDZ31DRAFT_62473 [Schizophyllum fasciatum]